MGWLWESKPTLKMLLRGVLDLSIYYYVMFTACFTNIFVWPSSTGKIITIFCLVWCGDVQTVCAAAVRAESSAVAVIVAETLGCSKTEHKAWERQKGRVGREENPAAQMAFFSLCQGKQLPCIAECATTDITLPSGLWISIVWWITEEGIISVDRWVITKGC